MNEEKKEAEPVSEESAQSLEEGQTESKEPTRQVPLEALEAERRKRQDAEAQARVYQDLVKRAEEAKSQKMEEESSEDDEEYVNRGELKKFHQKLTKEELSALKREIAEETYKDTKPEAIKAINSHLKEILERKPWLAETIASAPNRYARAYEIVNDYMPQVAEKKSQSTEAKKMVENAQKPGSPIGVGKSQKLSGSDYLKSIAGTKEFSDYRKQLLGR